MVQQQENTVDASREKHVPVVERSAEGVTVKVGSIAHPMEENHYIAWIEVIAGDAVIRRPLKPGDAPEAKFPGLTGAVTVREYCTLHGQWSAAS
jgi:superoxide reductase